MTITLFVTLFATMSVAVSFLTEAVKKLLDDSAYQYSTNLVVLIISAVVGVLGTAIAYASLGIAFTFINVICMLLMAVAVWVGSMVGYDKVIQMVEQIKLIQK